MNRARLLILGVVALLVAGGVSLRLNALLRGARREPEQPHRWVIAAGRDLAPGQKIAETDLRAVAMAGDLPAGAFTNPNDVVGRGVLEPMQKNELVLAGKLAALDAGAGLPALIPPGMRAVSVKVNDVISVAGFVGPGSHVDVLVTGTPGRDADPAHVTTTTVLQNVQVLAAGQNLQRDADGKPQDVTVITLLVTPQGAEKLALASIEGRIQLALRSPLDGDDAPRPAVQNAALYGVAAPAPVRRTARPQAPAPPPQAAGGTYEVEIIRGGKRDLQKF